MTRILRYTLFLAAVAVATSCGSNSSNNSNPTAPSTGNTGSAITIVTGARTLTTTAYNPNPLTITAGTTVTWTNMDSITHTATSDSGVFGSTIAPSAQFSFTFPNKGTFTYHCTLHPGMVGSVVVQ